MPSTTDPHHRSTDPSSRGRAVVLMVDNVSVEPFRLIAPPFDSVVQADTPSITWRQALRGEIDLAVVSVARLPEVADAMEPIGAFGVACTGPVGSVLLFSTHAVADLVRGRRPIHMTADSETSRLLLRLLCLHEFGMEPVVTQRTGEAEARLCIGDEALRRRLDPQGWPVAADLCGWWQARTGRPFVFARWMVRRSADASFRATARDWLDRCVDAACGAEGRRELVRRGLHAGLFGDAARADAYFAALRSRLTEDDLAAQAGFTNESSRLR